MNINPRFVDWISWANIGLIKFINLDLSLNSFLGIFLILVGVIVRIDFKFIIQKDLQ